jgi:hypothetical protein
VVFLRCVGCDAKFGSPDNPNDVSVLRRGT